MAFRVILQDVGTAKRYLAQWTRVDGILTFASRRYGQTTRIQQQRFDNRSLRILWMLILMGLHHWRRCFDLQRLRDWHRVRRSCDRRRRCHSRRYHRRIHYALRSFSWPFDGRWVGCQVQGLHVHRAGRFLR